MVWVGGCQNVDDGGLTSAVDFRDKIVPVFSSDLNEVDIQAGAVNDGAGPTSGFDRSIEQGMHGHSIVEEQAAF